MRQEILETSPNYENCLMRDWPGLLMELLVGIPTTCTPLPGEIIFSLDVLLVDAN